MAAESNSVDQAVTRTLRDNLEKIQRNADELHQAVNDLVSACASSRASNALPSMLRAQTSAAALSATLEVLSRFVTSALQSGPGMRSQYEPEPLRVPSMSMPAIPAFEPPPPPPPPSLPKEEFSWAPPVPVAPPAPPMQPVQQMPVQPPPLQSQPVFVPPPPPPPPVAEMHAVPHIDPPMEAPVVSQASAAVEVPPVHELAPPLEPVSLPDPEPLTLSEPGAEINLEFPAEAVQEVHAQDAAAPAEAGPAFNLNSLPPEEQELHRRAFRVAKVSMQDIRMLRPDDVKLGRENKDLCSRLRDDIEKAHKEYDRRFQPIQSHPVDYFYDWMVEILGGGDPQTLGEYPYRSPVARR